MDRRVTHPAPHTVTTSATSLPGPSASRKRAVVIGSLGWSLVNFRLDLMRRLQSAGYEVLALAADLDHATKTNLMENGIRPIDVPMDRTGTRPGADLKTLWALTRILRREAPDLVIAYTMKPILYGLLAAQLTGVPRRFALFTGLGYGFMNDRPTGRRAHIRRLAIWLHRICLRRITGAFCYNAADRRDIRRFGMIPARTPLWDIAGSGVDTARFIPTPLPDDPDHKLRFLFVGRMLASKGIDDLTLAARRLQADGHSFALDLVGPTDSNPDAIDTATLMDWQDQGLLTWHGETRDVAPHLARCSVFVLPTKLREGIPRSILEAMASGRAVITTDAPGCAETVPDGVCGLVVPRGDVTALTEAMARFIDTPALARDMGRAARAQACEVHDVHKINDRLMHLMGLDPSPVSGAHPATAPRAAGVAPVTSWTGAGS